MHANPVRTGLVVGLLVALWHVAWSTLVYFGVAQRLIDFVFWAHFMAPAFHVQGFEIQRAAALLAVTFGLGFVFGLIGAMIWNVLHGERAARP